MLVVEPNDAQYVGRIIQNETAPLTIAPGRRRLSAIVAESAIDRVREGASLVAEDDQGEVRLLCLIRKIVSYPQQSGIMFKAINEFVTRLELEPRGRVQDYGLLSLPNGNFNGFQLRPPSVDELCAAYQIPKEGLPCGHLVADSYADEVVFRVPRELLYRSAFVCGAKGSGKTSFLRTLLPVTMTDAAGSDHKPSIVILDVEGEFATRASLGLFEAAGARTKVVRLAAVASDADASMALSRIHPEHLAYFAPNLPMNSVLHLQSIYKELSFHYRESNIIPRAGQIMKDIQQAAWRKPGIHDSQRQALIRATSSDLFALFDQDALPPLIPEDMLHSGLVTVLDVSALTDEQQRIVALYLLSVFGSYKTCKSDAPGLLLVMDEAQKLFPQKQGDLMRDYAQRLGKFVGAIVRRGRRRQYGIILSTQHPADVSRDVMELCDTKLVFKMTGPQSWLKTVLGDAEFAKRASELGVGEAFLVSAGRNLTDPVHLRFAAPPPL